MVSRKLTPKKNLKRKYSPRRSPRKSKRTPPWHRKQNFDDEEDEEDTLYKVPTKTTAPSPATSAPSPAPVESPPQKVEIDEISITTEIQPLTINVREMIIESEIQTPKVGIDEIKLNYEIIQAPRLTVKNVDIDEVILTSKIEAPTVEIDEVILTSEIKTPAIEIEKVLLTGEIEKQPVNATIEIVTPVKTSMRRNDGEPGLLINGTLVSSISGPVSMHILKPTKEFHQSHKAPIFILFGDSHFSNENLCTECECSIENKSCCYEIYSDKFLLLLDEIAKDNTVYFSIEAGVDKNQDRNNEFIQKVQTLTEERKNTVLRFPMQKLREGHLACYSPSQEMRKNYCPTEHMLWHNADARQFTNKYDIDAYLLDFYDFVVYADKKQNDKVLQTLDKLISNPAYLEILPRFFEPGFHKIKNQTGLSPYQKQIEKMIDKDQWNNYVDLYYANFYKPQILYPKEEVFFGSVIQAIIKYKEDKNIVEAQQFIYAKVDALNRGFSAIADTILKFNIVSLDLYFLTRSFKTTSDGKNPLISIGYFGAQHSKNICDFLYNNMKNYEIVYNIDNHKTNIDTHAQNRCLPIDKFVNLDSMIEELTSKIVSQQVEVEEVFITSQIKPLSVEIDEIVLSTFINPAQVEVTDITLTTEIKTPQVQVDEMTITSQINSPKVEVQEVLLTSSIQTPQVPVDDVTITSQIITPQIEVQEVSLSSSIQNSQVPVDDVTITSEIITPQVEIQEVVLSTLINPSKVDIEEIVLTSSIESVQTKSDDAGILVGGQLFKSISNLTHINVAKSDDDNYPLVIFLELEKNEICKGADIVELLAKIEQHRIIRFPDYDRKRSDIAEKGYTRYNLIDFLVDILYLSRESESENKEKIYKYIHQYYFKNKKDKADEMKLLLYKILQEKIANDLVNFYSLYQLSDEFTHETYSQYLHIIVYSMYLIFEIERSRYKNETICFLVSPEEGLPFSINMSGFSYKSIFEEKIKTECLEFTSFFDLDAIITSRDTGLRIDGKIYKSMSGVNHISVLKSKDSNYPTIFIMDKDSVEGKCETSLKDFEMLINKVDKKVAIFESQSVLSYAKQNLTVSDIDNYLVDILLLLFYYNEFNNGNRKYPDTTFKAQREKVKQYKIDVSQIFPNTTKTIYDKYNKYVLDVFRDSSEKALLNFIDNFISKFQPISGQYEKLYEWFSHVVSNRLLIKALTTNFSKPDKKKTQILYINNEKDRKALTTFLTEKENLYELIFNENKGEGDCLKFGKFLDLDALNREKAEERRKAEVERKAAPAPAPAELAPVAEEEKKPLTPAPAPSKVTPRAKVTPIAKEVTFNINNGATGVFRTENIDSRKVIILDGVLNPLESGDKEIKWTWKCKEGETISGFKICLSYEKLETGFVDAQDYYVSTNECIYDAGNRERKSDEGIINRSKNYKDHKLYFIWDNYYSISTSKTITFTISPSVKLDVLNYIPSNSPKFEELTPKPHPLITKKE